jgi:hypothetical protein
VCREAFHGAQRNFALSALKTHYNTIVVDSFEMFFKAIVAGKVLAFVGR